MIAGGFVGGCALFVVGTAVFDTISRITRANPPIKFFDVDETIKTRTSASKLFRWIAAPVTAVGASWLLALNAAPIISAIPSLFSTYVNRVKAVIPLHPSNVGEAFDLGVAYEKMMNGMLADGIRMSEKIAGRTVSEGELRGVKSIVEGMMAETGVVDRVLRAFSLVNFIWFVAILGLTATSVPFLLQILKPLRHLMWRGYRVARRCALYAKPLFEPLLYAVSFYFFVEGARYAAAAADPYAMTGVMMTCTGLGAFALAWGFTTHMNATAGGNFSDYMVLSWSFAALYSAPQAVVHQSRLIGYLTAVSLVCALKFTAWSNGLCTIVGFNSFKDLFTAAVGCGTLTVVNFCLKASGVESRWLAPFQSGVGVIGTSVYLLCLDILAYLDPSRRGHIFYVANLIAYIALGEQLGMPGAANVAKTYFGLWLFTLYCVGFPQRDPGPGMVTWVFFLFVILYAVSLFLNRNPQYLVSVLSGGTA